jgi:uncharacterized protein DUF1902
MDRGLIVVKAACDADAGVWFVESSDVKGMNVEAKSLEALLEKLPGAILDLLEHEGFDDADEMPVEVVAHANGLKGVSRDPDQSAGAQAIHRTGDHRVAAHGEQACEGCWPSQDILSSCRPSHAATHDFSR